MPDARTISQLEADRYTSVLCTCNDDRCRNRIGYPFRLIRINHPQLLLSAMTIDELKARLRCGKCGGRDITASPNRQEDAKGYARSF
jgi:hypothetical protein